MLLEFMYAALTPVPEQQCAPGWHEAFADPSPYTCGLDYAFSAPGRLDLLPAGKLGPGYQRTVSTFNWQRFYDAFGGGVFLESVKAQMCKEYDYVLFNGASGLGDSAAPPVVQLPEILVVFYATEAGDFATFGSIVRSVESYRRASKRDGCRIVPMRDKGDFQPGVVFDRQLVDDCANLVSTGNLTKLIAMIGSLPDAALPASS